MQIERVRAWRCRFIVLASRAGAPAEARARLADNEVGRPRIPEKQALPLFLCYPLPSVSSFPSSHHRSSVVLGKEEKKEEEDERWVIEYDEEGTSPTGERKRNELAEHTATVSRVWLGGEPRGWCLFCFFSARGIAIAISVVWGRNDGLSLRCSSC